MDYREALYSSRDYTTDSQITEQVKTISIERLGAMIEPAYPSSTRVFFNYYLKPKRFPRGSLDQTLSPRG
eukprot:12919418-Prorocentrum_lima.AAC.1